MKDHDIGEQEVIIYDRLFLERHDYTVPKKLNEWDTLKIGFSLRMLKGNNHIVNYAQITKKQNENVNYYKTNSWQLKDSSLHPSTQVNKDVEIPINNFKDLKIWLRCWSEDRMEVVLGAAGRLAENFVFVVYIMARFHLVMEVMVVHSSQYDEQWMSIFLSVHAE